MTESQKIAALTEENEYLRDVVDSFEKDSPFALYFAMNRKNNEMAKVLNGSKLSLEDNSIKNYQEMVKKMEDTFAAVISLRKKYLNTNTDAELEEMESKGVPLIELRANEREQK